MQCINARLSIDVSACGSVRELSPEQFEKAWSPIVVTESGSVMEVRFLHLENSRPPMHSTPGGTTIFSIMALSTGSPMLFSLLMSKQVDCVMHLSPPPPTADKTCEKGVRYVHTRTREISYIMLLDNLHNPGNKHIQTDSR